MSTDRPKRALTPEEADVIEMLYRGRLKGYVTTTCPVPMGSTDGKGPWNGKPDRIVPRGSTLKIVMVSSMGDAGLTDDLKADRGYHVRLDWDDAAMTNIRLRP